MKKNDLRKYFVGKMGFERKQQSKHVGYIFRAEGQTLPLPTLIRHSRGSGEIRSYVIRSLARGMGFREADFKQAVEGTIGQACSLLCLATKLLHDCQLDPNVWPPNMIIPSIEALLVPIQQKQASKKTRVDWKNPEKKALRVSWGKLQKIIQDDQDLRPTARNVLHLIDSGMKPIGDSHEDQRK